jgi:hypothetical protein
MIQYSKVVEDKQQREKPRVKAEVGKCPKKRRKSVILDASENFRKIRVWKWRQFGNQLTVGGHANLQASIWASKRGPLR